jgi:hypothetical protein
LSTSESAQESKTDFVKDVLSKNPRANTAAVNDAWVATGRGGQISATLVNKLRSSLGLAGNLRARTPKAAKKPVVTKGPYSGKKRGRKPKTGVSVAHTPPAAPARSEAPRGYSVHDLEADIDRLIFKVMGLGGLEAVEESLRQSRRLLYSHNGTR